MRREWLLIAAVVWVAIAVLAVGMSCLAEVMHQTAP